MQVRKRILVVEDEGKIARLLAAELEEAGYDVHAEPLGAPAVEYAAQEHIDGVILDLMLPDMDGYEVCKALRHMPQYEHLPVLVLTALERPIHQLRGLAFGVSAYLTKPFRVREVVEAVQQLLTEPEADS